MTTNAAFICKRPLTDRVMNRLHAGVCIPTLRLADRQSDELRQARQLLSRRP